MNQPDRSHIVSDNNIKGSGNVRYTSKFIDGIQVIQECQEQLATNYTTSTGWDQHAVSTSHKDSITDIAVINDNRFLISSSKDGVIKLWK